jgi:hypothetical protein
MNKRETKQENKTPLEATSYESELEFMPVVVVKHKDSKQY